MQNITSIALVYILDACLSETYTDWESETYQTLCSRIQGQCQLQQEHIFWQQGRTPYARPVYGRLNLVILSIASVPNARVIMTDMYFSQSKLSKIYN